MTARRKPALSRWLHWLFETGLALKGVSAIAEVLAGLGLMFGGHMMFHRLAVWLAQFELTEEPHSGLALWVEQALNSFPIESQAFYGWYLIAHGVVKMAIVLGLVRRIPWAYPASMAVLAGFVLYQLRHWTQTGSPGLLLLSGFDTIMIVLIAREYRLMVRSGEATA